MGILQSGIGQNIIPNPSFEDYTYCPVNFNQAKLDNVKDWTQASRGTSDYFHSCSRVVGVPENAFGLQEAKEGEAYLGLITFAPTKRNYREYMQVKLKSPMGAGQLYCVSFYVSSADLSEYVSDGIGAVFSQHRIKHPGQRNIPRQMDLFNPAGNILDDSRVWFLLSDVYEARGGEHYLTLGNFWDDDELKVMRRNVLDRDEGRTWESAYYYVDKVSVTPVDSRAECSCTIPVIEAEIRDSLRWKLPPGKSLSLDNVLFEFDQDVLSPQSMQTLNEVGAWMRNNDFLTLEVKGHTDIIGRADYNLDLSQRRAQRVIDYLLDLGVNQERLSIRYYGASKPVADNTSTEGRGQNRRVDFEVTEEQYMKFDTRQ